MRSLSVKSEKHPLTGCQCVVYASYMVTSAAEKLDLEKINRSKIHRETGLTLSHVSRIFSGERRPSLEAARDIARSLGVTMEELTDFLDTLAVDRQGGLRAKYPGT